MPEYQVSDLEIERSAGTEQNDRYMIRGRAHARGRITNFTVYSDYTTNVFQTRKRGDTPELERTIKRLRDRFAELGVILPVGALGHLTKNEQV